MAEPPDPWAPIGGETSPARPAGPAPWAAGTAPPWESVAPPRPKAGSARTGPLPLHPMTVGDLLDGAFKLFKANARTVLTVTAAFLVPIQVVQAFLQRGTVFGGRGLVDLFNDPSLARSNDASDAARLAVLLISLAAALLVLPYLNGVISRVVAASYLGDELPAGTALASTAPRWWALTLSWILVHVVELGMVLLTVAFALLSIAIGIPGIALAVVFGLASLPALVVAMTLFVAVTPAVAVEELGPVRAMRRSAGLLRRRFWPVLGAALLAGLLASLVGNAVAVVPQMVGLAIGTGRGGWVLIALAGSVRALVSTPLVAIFATLIYFDARIRHEGLDLQLMAAELAVTR